MRPQQREAHMERICEILLDGIQLEETDTPTWEVCRCKEAALQDLMDTGGTISEVQDVALPSERVQ